MQSGVFLPGRYFFAVFVGKMSDSFTSPLHPPLRSKLLADLPPIFGAANCNPLLWWGAACFFQTIFMFLSLLLRGPLPKSLFFFLLLPGFLFPSPSPRRAQQPPPPNKPPPPPPKTVAHPCVLRFFLIWLSSAPPPSPCVPKPALLWPISPLRVNNPTHRAVPFLSCSFSFLNGHQVFLVSPLLFLATLSTLKHQCSHFFFLTCHLRRDFVFVCCKLCHLISFFLFASPCTAPFSLISPSFSINSSFLTCLFFFPSFSHR